MALLLVWAQELSSPIMDSCELSTCTIWEEKIFGKNTIFNEHPVGPMAHTACGAASSVEE